MDQLNIVLLIVIAVLCITFWLEFRVKYKDEDDLSKIPSHKLLELIPGSCDCMIKTNDLKHHSEDCKYRLIMEELSKRLNEKPE